MLELVRYLPSCSAHCADVQYLLESDLSWFARFLACLGYRLVARCRRRQCERVTSMHAGYEGEAEARIVSTS